MTEDEMEKLAELIFQKLLTRQAEFDEQFIEQLKSSGQEFEVEFDKWTTYASDVELPSTNVTWALAAGDYIWFVTNKI